MRDAIRLKHYSYRTEQSYVQWIRRYILFHNKRHPNEMGVPEIEAFLTHLAVQEHVAASTQNQALSALLFLYRAVLFLPLDERIDAVRAKPSRKLPTVLTKDEVRSILLQMTGDESEDYASNEKIVAAYSGHKYMDRIIWPGFLGDTSKKGPQPLKPQPNAEFNCVHLLTLHPFPPT